MTEYKAPVSSHSSILAEQNFEYEEVQRKMIEKKEEEEREEERRAIEQIEENAQLETKEAEIRKGQKEFENRSSSHPLTIKFRLDSKAVAYTFDLEDKG